MWKLNQNRTFIHRKFNRIIFCNNNKKRIQENIKPNSPKQMSMNDKIPSRWDQWIKMGWFSSFVCIFFSFKLLIFSMAREKFKSKSCIIEHLWMILLDDNNNNNNYETLVMMMSYYRYAFFISYFHSVLFLEYVFFLFRDNNNMK